MDTESLPEQYDQSYGPQERARTTVELNKATGIPPEPKRKRPRVPLSLAALVVIGVVAIVVAPQAIWLVSISIRPDEVGSTIPQQSEAVTISAITGMLGVVGGYAAAMARQGPVGRDEEDLL